MAGVWLWTSEAGKTAVRRQMVNATDAGTRPAPGTLSSGSIRTGLAPGAWRPYCPPGAHTGPHRMYHHPKKASPYLGDVAMRPDTYDWMFCPPSEGDL